MGTTPTTPKTWLAGTGLAADDMNTHVRDPISFLLNKPFLFVNGVGLTYGTHNVIPSGAWTRLIWNTATADTDAFWDSGEPGVAAVIPDGMADSWWRISATWQYTGTDQPNALGMVEVRLNAEGDHTLGTQVLEARYSQPDGAHPARPQAVDQVLMSAGDTLEVFAYQNTGGDRSTHVYETHFYLSWERFA